MDAAQTPTIKTKIAQLKFLTNLATSYCRSDEFSKQLPTNKAILKIVQLANDQKSVELRSQARACLIALYNCNTPDVSSIHWRPNSTVFNFLHLFPSIQMTAILSDLPKTYNDSAKVIIQQHLRRNTSGTNSPSSPLSCSSPKLMLSPQLGPFSSLQNHHSSKFSIAEGPCST